MKDANYFSNVFVAFNYNNSMNIYIMNIYIKSYYCNRIFNTVGNLSPRYIESPAEKYLYLAITLIAAIIC